jgi:hypothetical protein
MDRERLKRMEAVVEQKQALAQEEEEQTGAEDSARLTDTLDERASDSGRKRTTDKLNQ